MRLQLRFLTPLFWFIAAFLVAIVFFRTVDLTPKVDETFFFSSNDPHFKEDAQIAKVFPYSPFSIVSVRGDLQSPGYIDRLGRLTAELQALPETLSVQSLTNGPDNLKDALESPLWSRILVSEDGKSSFIFMTSENVPSQQIVASLERLQKKYHREDFEIALSGVPYIAESISRYLLRDLKAFSVAALFLFGVVLFLVFRSFWIVLGMAVACFHASAWTLIATHAMHIPIGPLTANLSTMIFVCTLSPMVFLTFNWKKVAGEAAPGDTHAVRKAIRMTISPSFWAVLTDSAGFASLLFVPSTPMKHLGVAGSLGTVAAMIAAYAVYPCFLQFARTEKRNHRVAADNSLRGVSAFFSKRHGLFAAGLIVLGLTALTGLKHVNPDPDLLSFFRKSGDIHQGLAYVDKNGGSCPLMLVVATPDRKPLKDDAAYKKLWALHNALEKDPEVGNALSLPIFLGEAKRSPLSFLMSTEWLLNILEGEKYGKLTQHFLTADKTQTLFLLRMQELGRKQPRLEIIEHLKGIVRDHGFEPVLIGGTYSLQGQMAKLLLTSTHEGSLLLIGVFGAMVLFLSRSLKVTAAMLACLGLIPVIMLGSIGWARLPLDVITSPAVNLSLGIGVDAMIYLSVFARRARNKEKRNGWDVWGEICSWYWRPIATSMAVICAGYSIFLLSNFPPTQRFGLFVVFGVIISDLISLFVFPFLSSLGLPRRKRNGKL